VAYIRIRFHLATMVFSRLALLSRAAGVPTGIVGSGAAGRVQAAAAARRSFGGHGPKRVRPKEYGGFLAPEISPIHKHLGEGMVTVMWLWIFYQTKETWKIHLVSSACGLY
jgi:hypothetical protein